VAEFISFIYVQQQLDRTQQVDADSRMLVASIFSVGCRHDERRHSLPSIGPLLVDSSKSPLFYWYKRTRVFSFSQLRTGAQTGCISTTIKYCTHTNSTLSLVSSITRSYVLCLISFYNPQNYYNNI